MSTLILKTHIKVNQSYLLIKQKGLSTFLKYTMQYFFWQISPKLKIDRITTPRIIKKLHEQLKNINTDNLEELIDLGSGFNYHGQSIKAGQVREEITQLLSLLKTKKAKNLMELGTNNGGTLFLLCQNAPSNATIISLDLPGGQFGGGYPKWKTKLYQNFSKPNQILNLVTGDSHKQETLDHIKFNLNGEKLDFLLIDGNHTYNGVKQDFQMYAPLVRKGGIIAFHDITENKQTTGCNVAQFWDEIKQSHPYQEFVKDSRQGWGGIGVIYY